MKKLPWGISQGESFGASVHVALKRWGELELGGEKVLGVGRRKQKKDGVREDQMGLFVEHAAPADVLLTQQKLLEIWHECFVFDTYPTRFEADFARSRGEALMRQFFAWWSQSPRVVVGVEKGFSVDVDGVAVTGRLDRVEQTEQGIRIIDFKSTAPCTQEEADADLQLSLYALASDHIFDRPCTELLLLFLSDEGVTERSTVRSASQLKDARTQLRLINERMLAKDFRPTPGAPVCRRCPYRNVCDVAAV